MSKDRRKPGPAPLRAADRRVALLARVKPEIRSKLESLAKAKKKSLSQVVELLLDRKLIDVEWRGDHHYWFGLLAGRIAWEVEQRMQLNPPHFSKDKGWLKHPFAAHYVRATILGVLDDLLPNGPIGSIPADMKRTARQLPPGLSQEQIDYFNSPDGLGRELARELMHQLRHEASPFADDDEIDDFGESLHVQDADLMLKIARGLDLRKGRATK
jgi:hypothetical protein